MSYDFKYYGFGVYFENIKTYIANIEAHRKKIKFRSSYEPFYAQGIIEGMIHAIADKDVQFDVKDVMLCRILEEMIIKGGYNNAGVYTDAAHKALRNLYIMQGKDPNSCVLYNKTIGGTMDHMKSKLKNFFGLDKKSAREPAATKQKSPSNTQSQYPVQTQPGKTETKNQSDRKPQSQPTKESLEKRLAAVKEQIEKIENTAYSAEKVKKLNQEKNTIQNKIKAAKKHDVKITAETSQAQKNAVKTSTKKKLFYRMTAVFTGLMAIGATILMTSDSSKMSNMVESNTSKTPTFKTVYASDATHSYVHTYNLGDSLSKTYNFDGQASNTIKTQPSGTTKPNIGPTESNTTTDAIAAQITKSSKSALDILLGAQKANELCHEVQSQIDAGIFAAPKGMSVERIAHAMTMSRIYEGRSIILDALKAKTKLTPADQAAFEQHIAEIGDMGTGLQKRMAEKHKLSTYSKFDNASKQLQKLHIQNLKTLKRMQKQAHTR